MTYFYRELLLLSTYHWYYLNNMSIYSRLHYFLYFQAHMKFPPDYPYSPPSIRFLTKVWHPNVYEVTVTDSTNNLNIKLTRLVRQNGDLCISILHPPVDDPQSGELPCERWNPTQNVRTILLSVISLLNEPNTFSPANVDASVMYRRWRDSQGKDNEYPNIIRQVTKMPFKSISYLKERRQLVTTCIVMLPSNVNECFTFLGNKHKPLKLRQKKKVSSYLPPQKNIASNPKRNLVVKNLR